MTGKQIRAPPIQNSFFIVASLVAHGAKGVLGVSHAKYRKIFFFSRVTSDSEMKLNVLRGMTSTSTKENLIAIGYKEI